MMGILRLLPQKAAGNDPAWPPARFVLQGCNCIPRKTIRMATRKTRSRTSMKMLYRLPMIRIAVAPTPHLVHYSHCLSNKLQRGMVIDIYCSGAPASSIP
jgi:hypothetical protein